MNSSNSKKKVLLCSPKGGCGGIAQWTNHILNYYDGISYAEVDLKVLPMDRKSFVSESMPIYKRVLAGFREYSAIIKVISKEISQNHYDIVHLVSSASLGLLKDIIILKRLKKKKIKSIVHFRFGRIPELFDNQNWETYLLKRVIRVANKTIVIDKRSFETLQKAGFSNIAYLPNPVSTAIAPIIDSNAIIVRKPTTILFAGHIISTKGVFELIDACNNISDIHLKMIGLVTSDMKEKLKDKINPKDNSAWIEMPGNLSFEEVIKEMLSCTVFVLPTYTEGFPNVILESMACGCPIVTTPVGAIPEMLDIYGENDCGICVEPKNVEQLKNAIETMLNDREYAERCGNNAQKRVNELYSMPVVWNQLVDIWRNV